MIRSQYAPGWTRFDGTGWRAGDFGRLRSILAEDVTFDGPLGHASNADECIAGLQRMSKLITGIDIRKTFVDGPDVLTWFDLHTAQTDLQPLGLPWGLYSSKKCVARPGLAR